MAPAQRLLIRNVHLAHEPSLSDAQSPITDNAGSRLYNICIENGVVKDVSISLDAGKSQSAGTREEGQVIECGGEGVMIPSLIHAHVHLDKCFILRKCDELVSGNLAEALRVTGRAKARFGEDGWADVYARGRRLVEESVESGVTCMRAYVEVDTTVGMGCVDVGRRLVREWRGICDVQLCAFAQDPLYVSKDDESPGENMTLLQAALEVESVAAVGSAPYLEPSVRQAKLNIDHVLDLACTHAKHADFHLDNNVDVGVEPLIFYLAEELGARVRSGRWVEGKWVNVGHATRLTLFTRAEWEALRRLVEDGGLPISLVGLPHSDMYMMDKRWQGSKPDALPLPSRRYVLDPVEVLERDGLEVAMAVNNVDNAFTPQGSLDPLGLCMLGVAVFQRATPKDCAILLRSVTTMARKAIGITPGSGGGLFPAKGSRADFVILHKNTSVQSAVLDPCYDRTTIKDGRVVATRVGNSWIASQL